MLLFLNRKSIFKFYALFLCSFIAAAEFNVQLTVDSRSLKSMNGKTRFEKNDWLAIVPLNKPAGANTTEYETKFYPEFGIYQGREIHDNWYYNANFSHISNMDPDREGYLHPNWIGGTQLIDYFNIDWARVKQDYPGYRFMITEGKFPKWAFQNNDIKNPAKNMDGIVEMFSEYYKQAYRKFGSYEYLPEWISIINEPETGHIFGGWAEMGSTWKNYYLEFHDKVLKKMYIDHGTNLKMAGLCEANVDPTYDNLTSSGWTEWYKPFIDNSGDEPALQAWDFHLYDRDPRLYNYGSGLSNFASQYEAEHAGAQKVGSLGRVDAKIDLLQNYLYVTHGRTLEVCVSEGGVAGGVDSLPAVHTPEELYKFRRNQFFHIQAIMGFILRLMERVDVAHYNVWAFAKTAFDNGFYRQLYPNWEDGGESHLLEFFRFWKPVQGEQLECVSDKFYLLARAFVDGDSIHIVAKNQSDDRAKLYFNQSHLLKTADVLQISSIDKRTLYWNETGLGSKMALKTDSLSTSAEYTYVEPGESVHIQINFVRDLRYANIITEKAFYGKQFWKSGTVTVPLPPTMETPDEPVVRAKLYLGLSKSSAFTSVPVVYMNSVPVSFRNLELDDMAGIASLMKVYVLDIPVEILNRNQSNVVSITLESGGRLISSRIHYGYSRRNPDYYTGYSYFPLQESSVLAWYDTSDVSSLFVSGTSNVFRMGDLSVNRNDATNSTVIHPVILTNFAGGLSMVKFNKGSVFTLSKTNYPSAGTIGFVFKLTNIESFNILFEGIKVSGGITNYNSVAIKNGEIYLRYGTGAIFQPTGLIYSTNVSSLLMYSFTNGKQILRNGLGDVKTNFLAGNFSPINWSIGGRKNGGGSNYSGAFGQFLYFDKVLNDDEKNSMEEVLGWQWDVIQSSTVLGNITNGQYYLNPRYPSVVTPLNNYTIETVYTVTSGTNSFVTNFYPSGILQIPDNFSTFSLMIDAITPYRTYHQTLTNLTLKWALTPENVVINISNQHTLETRFSPVINPLIINDVEKIEYILYNNVQSYQGVISTGESIVVPEKVSTFNLTINAVTHYHIYTQTIYDLDIYPQYKAVKRIVPDSKILKVGEGNKYKVLFEKYGDFPLSLELTVYDSVGIKRSLIYSGEQVGRYAHYYWDYKDDEGKSLPGGIYFLKEILKYDGREEETINVLVLIY